MKQPSPNQTANLRLDRRIARMGHKRFNGASSDLAVEAQLDAVLQSLYTLFHKDIELGLTRTYRFLEDLGNPHLRLPKVVHVAGTNGKGSTMATLRALLEASGHKVHCYTSPHLVHPTERIRLAGEPITSEAFLAVLNECIEINQNKPITFWEITTCAAFLMYSRIPADFLLLETGMGGRLDMTNVIEDPVATIITTISYDHMAFLGDTLPKIAYEKAGIMKPGVPCVVGYQMREAIQDGVPDVLHKYSQGLSPEAPLVRYGAEWSSAFESDRLVFRYGSDSITTVKPSLSGNHQAWNAGAALAAFRIIAPDHFTPEIISTALADIEWPGRLQTLENHPFNNMVPEGWEIIIDGGHNDSAGLVLAAQMEEWVKVDNRPLHLIVAMVDRKDPVAFLKPLLPYSASLTATCIENEPTSFKPANLGHVAGTLGFLNVTVASNPAQALKELVHTAGIQQPARVLITGSLFLMGNILGLHN